MLRPLLFASLAGAATLFAACGGSTANTIADAGADARRGPSSTNDAEADAVTGAPPCSPVCDALEDTSGKCKDPARPLLEACRPSGTCANFVPAPSFDCVELSIGPLTGESTQCCAREICSGVGAECFALPDVNGLCKDARENLVHCCAKTAPAELDCRVAVGTEPHADYCCARGL